MATLCAIIRGSHNDGSSSNWKNALKSFQYHSRHCCHYLTIFDGTHSILYTYTLSSCNQMARFISFRLTMVNRNETTFKFILFIPFITASLFSVETCLADWFVTTYCGWSHDNYLIQHRCTRHREMHAHEHGQFHGFTRLTKINRNVLCVCVWEYESVTW